MTLPRKPVRDPAYLKAVRSMPCIVTLKRASAEESVVPAHLRCASGGVGQKPDDRHVLPLLASEHDQQHREGELPYWLRQLNADRALLKEILRLAARGRYEEWRDDQ